MNEVWELKGKTNIKLELKPRCFYPKFRTYCYSFNLYEECSKGLIYPKFEDRPCKEREG